MSEMSIGENVKTFLNSVGGFLALGPAGKIAGKVAEKISENKEAKELTEAKTDENEQVETNIEDTCCHLQETIDEAKEKYGDGLGGALTAKTQLAHDIAKATGTHEIIKQGGLLKMGINAVKGWFKK